MGSAAKASNARSATDGMPDERGHQVQSEVIERNQMSSSATDGMPDERGHQVRSEVIKSDQRSSCAIRRNQVQSELVRRNQSSSDAISTGRLLHAAVEAAFVALGLDDAIGHMPRARQEETWPRRSSVAIRGNQVQSELISRNQGRKRPGQRREARLPN